MPGMPMPLHIFEERYKQMVDECLEDSSEFGMVLADEGGTRNVGCTARIVELVQRYEDGRLVVLVEGSRRFKLNSIVTGIALFILSIFIGNPLPATAGATVLAATIGFGAQSLLRDIIAGFSIVFEGQYSVGDFVEIEPTKAAGLVEELGLRTTKIRALSGELIFIPNGTITGVRNYISGEQRFTIEVQISDANAVDGVIGSLSEASNLYLIPPRLVGREETNGRTQLRILAGVLPSMAWLVEENLVERIKAAAGEGALASEPLIYKVDQANLTRIRSLIPEAEERI